MLLFSKKKYEECMGSLRKIAKVNGKTEAMPEVTQIVEGLKAEQEEKDSQ